MDIVVINLDSQAERWACTQARFGRLGLQPQRLAAVDGRLLGSAEREAWADAALNRRQHHKPLQPGEIGCYASHLRAWHQLLASRQQALAVFEDDVEPDASLPGALAALEQLSAEWDIVKLFGRVREYVDGSRPLDEGHTLVRYRRVPSHTCAYVVSRRGAHKLLASRQPFGRPVDVDLRHWWENDMVIYGVQPYPVRRAPESRVSAIDEARRGCSTPAMRLRKIHFQLRYAALNWWHGSARPAVPALQAAERALGDAA